MLIHQPSLACNFPQNLNIAKLPFGWCALTTLTWKHVCVANIPVLKPSGQRGILSCHTWSSDPRNTTFRVRRPTSAVKKYLPRSRYFFTKIATMANEKLTAHLASILVNIARVGAVQVWTFSLGDSALTLTSVSIVVTHVCTLTTRLITVKHVKTACVLRSHKGSSQSRTRCDQQRCDGWAVMKRASHVSICLKSFLPHLGSRCCALWSPQSFQDVHKTKLYQASVWARLQQNVQLILYLKFHLIFFFQGNSKHVFPKNSICAKSIGNTFPKSVSWGFVIFFWAQIKSLLHPQSISFWILE